MVVTGWLCCCVSESYYEYCSIQTRVLQSRFIPLAIFRDRLTALLYAYSVTFSKTQEKSLSRPTLHHVIFIEDETNGYEEALFRAYHTVRIDPEEPLDVERFTAKVRQVEIHYEGIGAEGLGFKFDSIKTVDILVFPLQILNPPTDTVSPYVKLTFTFCLNESQTDSVRNHFELIEQLHASIVISKCEGFSRKDQPCINLSPPNSQHEWERKVAYFPFGSPFLSGTLNRLSKCLADEFPTVSCINQISNDLVNLIALFLPFNFIVQFLKLPCQQLADSEEKLKQLIRFWLPKRTSMTLKLVSDPIESMRDLRYIFKSTRDFWEAIAKSLNLKYSRNEIPENANWSDLRIVVYDLSEDVAVRRAVSFLHDKIPSKYLSDGLTCVVQLLWITKAFKRQCRRKNRWFITKTYILEFYEVDGIKHCDWYPLSHSFEHNLRHFYPQYLLDFIRNSTFVYLKQFYDDWDSGDVVVNNLSTYLLTAYDHNVGISCDSSNIQRDESSYSSSEAPLSIVEDYRTPHSKNVELLLNKVRMDVSTLRQLWTQIATLFQISNFSFINHQDQTTPVHTPTNLLVLIDREFILNDTPPVSCNYFCSIRFSALSTAFRNNSSCLRAFQSFNVNVVVLSIRKHDLPRKGVCEISTDRLEISTNNICEIKKSGFGFDEREFSSLASLRHRPLQVECWDPKLGGDYQALNPFGFVPKPDRHDDYEIACSKAAR